MKPPVDFLKSRTCISVPAKYRSLTLVDSHSEVCAGKRSEITSSWQQFGFLCDLIVPSEDQRARYYQELPIDYVRESEFGSAERYFTISLEYGPDHDKLDPFDIAIGRIAQDDPERSHQGRYLHPVVRFYRRQQLVAEHHVAENLGNEWTGPAHREPLAAFFARSMERSPVTADVAA